MSEVNYTGITIEDFEEFVSYIEKDNWENRLQSLELGSVPIDREPTIPEFIKWHRRGVEG